MKREQVYSVRNSGRIICGVRCGSVSGLPTTHPERRNVVRQIRDDDSKTLERSRY